MPDSRDDALDWAALLVHGLDGARSQSAGVKSNVEKRNPAETRRGAEANDISRFHAAIPDEDAALARLVERRWGKVLFCPHCESEDAYANFAVEPMSFICGGCFKPFNVRTGTVMEKSTLPLKKWLLAIYLIYAKSKVPSTGRIAKLVGVNRRTADYLKYRINGPMPYDGEWLVGCMDEE